MNIGLHLLMCDCTSRRFFNLHVICRSPSPSLILLVWSYQIVLIFPPNRFNNLRLLDPTFEIYTLRELNQQRHFVSVKFAVSHAAMFGHSTVCWSWKWLSICSSMKTEQDTMTKIWLLPQKKWVCVVFRKHIAACLINVKPSIACIVIMSY